MPHPFSLPFQIPPRANQPFTLPVLFLFFNRPLQLFNLLGGHIVSIQAQLLPLPGLVLFTPKSSAVISSSRLSFIKPFLISPTTVELYVV